MAWISHQVIARREVFDDALSYGLAVDLNGGRRDGGLDDEGGAERAGRKRHLKGDDWVLAR
ncbi:MAG: hypothetical protein U0324_37035 [Polyangiales bacterium]